MAILFLSPSLWGLNLCHKAFDLKTHLSTVSVEKKDIRRLNHNLQVLKGLTEKVKNLREESKPDHAFLYTFQAKMDAIALETLGLLATRPAHPQAFEHLEVVLAYLHQRERSLTARFFRPGEEDFFHEHALFLWDGQGRQISYLLAQSRAMRILFEIIEHQGLDHNIASQPFHGLLEILVLANVSYQPNKAFYRAHLEEILGPEHLKHLTQVQIKSLEADLEKRAFQFAKLIERLLLQPVNSGQIGHYVELASTLHEIRDELTELGSANLHPHSRTFLMNMDITSSLVAVNGKALISHYIGAYSQGLISAEQVHAHMFYLFAKNKFTRDEMMQIQEHTQEGRLPWLMPLQKPEWR